MKFQKVLLRGHKSEPLIRYLGKADDGTLMVRNARSYTKWKDGGAPDHWIGWPNHDVYKYDEEIFKKLKTLFDRGMKSEIQKAWLNEEKIDLA